MSYNNLNLILLYKIIKYVQKSKKYQLLNNINSGNIRNIYHLAKNNYLRKQTGGTKLTEDQIQNTKIMHLCFHGTISSNKKLIVLPNMHLIIPLCCGFTNKECVIEHEFFSKSELDLKYVINENLIGDSVNMLQIGFYDKIILKPGDIYCDIEIKIYFDLNINEGILTNNDKVKFLKKHYIDYQKELVKKSFVITQNDINILYYLIKNESYSCKNVSDIYLFKEKMQYVENLNSNNISIFTINCLYNEHFNSIKIKYIAKLEDMITQLNIKKLNITDTSFYDKLINFIDDINATILTNDRKNLFKKYTSVFDNLYNIFNDVPPSGKETFKIIVKCFNDIDGINIQSELLQKINVIISNNDNILNFVQNLKPENISLSAHIDYNEISQINDKFKIDFSYELTHDSNLFAFADFMKYLYACCYATTTICELEKDFIKFILKDKSSYVKIYLSDLLNFIRTTEREHLFIFNNSCQPFNNKIQICEAGRCLSNAYKKISSQPTQDTIFNNENLSDLSNAIEYIKGIDLTYFDEPIPEIFTNVQAKWEQLGKEYSGITEIGKYKKTLLNYDKNFHDGQKITDILHIYIVYTKNKFPKLYNVFVKNMGVFDGNIKIMLTILNIFITEFYNDTTIEHQQNLINIMGNLY